MTRPEQQSVLIIGASGRSGLEILRQFITHPSKPLVHAFCRTASKLPQEYHKVCASVIEGDACNASDVEQALTATEADVVVLSIGNGDSVAKSDVRTVSAQVVATIMKKPGFEHVRAVVVSSTGAGPSNIKVGLGFGKLIEHHLRHVLKDHTGQEGAFLDNGLGDRTIIVRATSLTDNEATGKVVTFGDNDKSPTIKIDRGDVATWIVREICDESDNVAGKIVNITGQK